MADIEDHHHGARYIRYALIALGVILVVLFLLFVGEYLSLRRQQIINEHDFRLSVLQRHAPLPVNETNVIRVWMTFDYINRLFALPPTYLQTQLQVTDSRYPRLSLGTYAKSKNIAIATFLSEVDNAIQSYVPPQVSTSTVATTTVRSI